MSGAREDGAPLLPDGEYDAFVVDARVEGTGEGTLTHLELTITTGPHKGEVVEVVARGLGRDELDLLGMPATLTVSAGAPSVRVD